MWRAHLLFHLPTLAVGVASRGTASAQQLETIVTWNRVIVTALGVPGAQPATIFVTRPLSMVSAAMFNAANAFSHRYHPYAVLVTPASGASPDAAVAQAAHDVLVALVPSQRATFDTALADTLANLPSGAGADGSLVGATVAQAVLDVRTGDGWERPLRRLELPRLLGYWRPTPPGNANAAFTNYPDVTGFIVANGRRFSMEGAPPLASERYAHDP